MRSTTSHAAIVVLSEAKNLSRRDIAIPNAA